MAVLATSLLVGGFCLYWFLSAETGQPPSSGPTLSSSPLPSGHPASTSPAKPHSSPRPAVTTPWQSGVSYPDAPGFTAAAQAEAAQAFGAWRGSAVGVAVAWPARATWADFTQADSFYRTWAAQPYTKSFGIPLFPDDAGATVEGCIAGSYDDQWRTFAATMNRTGLAAQGTIIRLGWEFNNQSPQWGSPDQFAPYLCSARSVSTKRLSGSDRPS